jgi:hypothetical protein
LEKRDKYKILERKSEGKGENLTQDYRQIG